MSYYSEVVLVLTKENVDKLMNKIEQDLFGDDKEKVLNILNCAEFYDSYSEEKSSVWYWKEIDWYPTVFEYYFIERFLCLVDEEDYLFIRIGEDITDNQIEGCYFNNPFDVSFQRTITLSV